MPMYHRLGEIPRKRHIAFRKPDGSLYLEELVGNKGFTGPSSLLYHLHPPTEVLSVEHLRDVTPEADPSPDVRHRHFRTKEIPEGRSPTMDRHVLMFNND